MFFVGNIYSYPDTERESYDIIVCFETIEHVDDYNPALRNLRTLLKPGGLLIISSPNRPITSPHCKSLNDRPGEFHFQEFTIKELTQQLILAGFKINSDGIYGQRQQAFVNNQMLMWLHKLIFKPKKRADPNSHPGNQ